MIGDNSHADIAAATTVGLPATLVSRDRPSTSPLIDAAQLVLNSPHDEHRQDLMR